MSQQYWIIPLCPYVPYLIRPIDKKITGKRSITRLHTTTTTTTTIIRLRIIICILVVDSNLNDNNLLHKCIKSEFIN